MNSDRRRFIGWSLLLVVVVSGGVVLLRSGGSRTRALTELVEIKSQDGAETWKVPLGAIIKQLMERPYPVDEGVGLANPESGKVGFPTNGWHEVVVAVNKEREADLQASTPGH